ncbi:MAG: hypothetical protein K9J77_11150 [Rhodoferax sp.]|nr:hypothetical protein [Rhodoferax sp.]
MSPNERLTCKGLIEPRMAALGWAWQEQLRIGPGRLNLTGDALYDEAQSIVADHLLRYRGLPLAIVEAKSESESAADGMQQASRYAHRLSLRFTFALNGNDCILTKNETGEFKSLSAPPPPDKLVTRMAEQSKIIRRLDAAHDLMRQLAAESLPGEVEVLRGAILRKAFAVEL